MLPRMAPPVTGRLQSAPYPAAAPASTTTRLSASRQVRLSPRECHSGRTGTPRIVRVGPSTRKGTRRSFLIRSAQTAPQKASSGPTLARGASADPAGLTARTRPKARPGSARRTSETDWAHPGHLRVWRLSRLKR
jgi:hypothetical protein